MGFLWYMVLFEHAEIEMKLFVAKKSRFNDSLLTLVFFPTSISILWVVQRPLWKFTGQDWCIHTSNFASMPWLKIDEIRRSPVEVGSWNASIYVGFFFDPSKRWLALGFLVAINSTTLKWGKSSPQNSWDFTEVFRSTACECGDASLKKDETSVFLLVFWWFLKIFFFAS